MKTKMKMMRASVLAAVLVVVMAVALPGYTAAASGGGTVRSAASGKAPSDPPIGDPALAREEARCAAALPSAPWYQTLVRTFNSDAEHSGLFQCAQFSGSMTGPNRVEAHQQTSEVYDTPFSMATLGPEDAYVYGGCGAQANPPALVTFVAKVGPGTLKQIWRTQLADASQNNEIHLCGSVQAIADGSLIATADHTLYKLDGGTGKIIAQLNVPTGETAPNDAAVNGSDAFSDGTIILKTWNRVAGCTQNGITAMLECKGALTGSAAPSILTAVDPKSLKVLDSVNLGTNISSRISTTTYQGHEYVYITSSKQMFRYEWDGHTLKKDSSWGPVNYTETGETGGGTPTVMNDWIIDNTNGITIPMHIVAVSQADASLTSIQPNTTLPPGQHSTSAAKPTVDPANNRIYMCDFNLGTCSAIDLRDGKLSLAWKENMRTQAFTSLIGPPDKRVFVATNMQSSTETDPTKYDYGPSGANFTEQYQWRDANTGKLLAASDYYPPKSEASQTPPGYGGLIYGLTNNGYVVALFVKAVPGMPGTGSDPYAQPPAGNTQQVPLSWLALLVAVITAAGTGTALISRRLRQSRPR